MNSQYLFPTLVFAAFLVLLNIGPTVFGQAQQTPRPPEPTTLPTFSEMPKAVPLWDKGAPGSEGQTKPERIYWLWTAPIYIPVVTDINNPSITPFIPDKDKATGAAIIIAPGGGHQFLAIDHEGYGTAKWFADHGIAAFVLKYRLARAQNSPYSVDVHALMDGQRAIRLVRSRAAEWGVDPKKVGFLGYSAGGELAAIVGTEYDKPVPGSNDDIDKLSCRPDFQVWCYPGMGRRVLTIPKNAPDAFLCCSLDDRNVAASLPTLFNELKDANVNVELHIYNKGGHGFGIRDSANSVATWPYRLLDWMGDRGFITKPAMYHLSDPAHP